MPYPVPHGVTTFLPPPKDYVVDFDNPQKRDALKHFLIFGFLGSLAILCLAQRLYTKHFIARGLKIDDVLLIFAWACSIIMQGVQMWSISIGGLCHHAWEMPIDVFEKHMLSSYIAGPVFIICNGLSKTTLLTFYLQISPQVWYRRVIFATIAFVILYTLTIADLLLFGCKPIRTAWDPYRFATGKCVDNAIVYIVTAVVNIISDVILFFILMPMLVHLKMPLGQRIGAGIMFGIASVTVATSIIRMVYLPPLLGAVDIPWIAAPANGWSIVEANLFIICTSMTTLRKFFQHVAPNWMGSSIVYSSEPVPDQSQTNKQKRNHTGHIQHDSVELANYPDAVKHDTL
ncbi:related to monocarboxylate transporter 2 [Fusarium torulosum]|uniref:Related to monocarboxylate transporter 2 n=1 Tax=Fusarium torulosum TaxID=33205 RepID=A0AAE8MAF2_9HYPO|nr:related to monocarboxylate transporter 2 [Fusarium torulosum]